MKYHACATENGEAVPSYFGEVRSLSEVGAPPLALRHARAMKAVLLAAKAWGKEYPDAGKVPPVGRMCEAVARLERALGRLAKIEKEASRG